MTTSDMTQLQTRYAQVIDQMAKKGEGNLLTQLEKEFQFLAQKAPPLWAPRLAQAAQEGRLFGDSDSDEESKSGWAYSIMTDEWDWKGSRELNVDVLNHFELERFDGTPMEELLSTLAENIGCTPENTPAIALIVEMLHPYLKEDEETVKEEKREGGAQ